MCLNLVLLLVSVAILLLNGGHFAQEINFTSSPNPGYHSGPQCCHLWYLLFLLTAVLRLSADWWIKPRNRKEFCERYCFRGYCDFNWLFFGDLFMGRQH